MRVWTFALLAACSGGHPAVAPDAAPDAEAPQDVPPTGSINVLAAYADVPTPGAIVLFCDAAGHVVDREITGGDGVATGMAPTDAMVTVLPPPGMEGALYTWVGAQPGDFLYTDQVSPHSGPVVSSPIVVLPPDGDTGVLGYELAMPGFSASYQLSGPGPIMLQGWLPVHSLTAHDAVADATHVGNHHRFFVVHDVTVGPTPLDLTAETWSDPTVVDLSLVNLPIDAVWFMGDYALLSGDQEIWNNHDINIYGPDDVTLHLDTPGAVGDGTALQLYFQRSHDAEETLWSLAYNGAPSTIDLAAIALPVPTDVLPRPDGSTSWNVTGYPADWLAQELTLSSQAGAWHVLLPPDRHSFELPQLPADLPLFGPVTSANVSFLGGNDPGGYAAARRDPAAFRPDLYGSILPRTPGVYRYSGERYPR